MKKKHICPFCKLLMRPPKSVRHKTKIWLHHHLLLYTCPKCKYQVYNKNIIYDAYGKMHIVN